MCKFPAVLTVTLSGLSPLGLDTSTRVMDALPSKFAVTLPRLLKVTVVAPPGVTATVALTVPSCPERS